MGKTKSFEKELHSIRLQIIKFVYNSILIATFCALAVYLYNFLFQPSGFKTNSIIFSIITIVLAVVFGYVRLSLTTSNYRKALWLVVSIIVFISSFFALIYGTYATIQYPLIVIALLCTVIVTSLRKALLLLLTVIVIFLAIMLLHSTGQIAYSPYQTVSSFQETAIMLVLLGVIFNIGRIGFGQIEHSYAKALAYSSDLENLNKSLDTKVKERTQLLQENYDTQLEAIYNTAVIGSITKPLLHDIATPISALLGTIDLLKRSKKMDAELLDLALGSTQQIADIINESRDLIRGKNIVETFAVEPHIKRSVRILQNELDRADIDLKYEPFLDLYVNGPIGLFERIIINILVNAIEELKNKKGMREIKISTEVIDDNKLVIVITDNGNGIAPEYIDKIFDADFSQKHTYYNLGLGLPFVKKQIEEKFNGTIKISSVLGSHTEVRLQFNLHTPPQSENTN